MTADQPYTPSLDKARDFLTYADPKGERVFRWADPRITLADDKYLVEGVEALARMIEAVRAEEREKALVEGFREGVNFIDNFDSPSWGGSMVAGRHEAARREEEYAARIRAQEDGRG